MATGLFDTTLDRETYSRGDVIKCKCRIRLGKPVKAQALRVVFELTEGMTETGKKIKLIERDIGPARTYQNGEEFEFSLPVDEKTAPDLVKHSGLFGMMRNALGAQIFPWQAWKWEIRIYLYVPGVFMCEGWNPGLVGVAWPKIQRPIVQK